MAKLDEIKTRLWAIADNLRANSSLKSSEYFEPVLGLIFLRFASERVKQVTVEIQAAHPAGYKITDDDYLERGALVLPPGANFDELLKLPESTNMGEVINNAMSAIEARNEGLKGALPKSFTRLTTYNIFALLQALNNISFDIDDDVFGKIYKYFLGKFAMAEGQRGGEFFTPTSIAQLIVEVIEPFKGCILDPVCGSGGMFIQSACFVRSHQLNPAHEVSVWGQEIMEGMVRLCRMHLAVNGLSGNIALTNSLYGEIQDLWGQFDYVMANPPFNVSGIDRTKIMGDNRRYPFGPPRMDNANYLWIQMFYSALNANGRAGFVMANSASDARNSELDIRRQLLEKKAVDVIISVSPNFFYTVTLPCTLWFLDKGKVGTGRENKVLFIDARNIYRQVDSAHREFWPEDIEYIANIVRLYRGEQVEHRYDSQRLQETFPDGAYTDIPGLCKVATLAEIAAQEWSLNPGRYTELLTPSEKFGQVKLHEIAEIQRGLPLRSKDPTEKVSIVNSPDLYFVKSRDIRDNGNIDIKSLEKVNFNDNDITMLRNIDKKYFLQPYDMLVATLGNVRNIPVAIINDDLPENTVFTQSLIRIRVNAAVADPQSVFTFLRSETGQQIMRSYASSLGSNLPQINASTLGQISIFLPNSSHTKEVNVEELSILSQVVHQLKNDILPTLDKLAEQPNSQAKVNDPQMESVAGRLKELAFLLSPPSLADKVMNSYPMPIALAYRRFLEAKFNVYEQVSRLKDLFEATGFFIYNVVLADALQRLDPNQYRIADKGARKAYNGYSMSTRIDFVDAIISIAKSNNGKDLFLPELVQSSVVPHAKELQDKFRNQLSHIATPSESQQRKILKKYQPVVEEMLTQLEFLSAYRLIRVPEFHIKKGKLTYRIEIYQGVMPKVDEKENVSLIPIHAEHDHIVLMDRDDKILDLHPLYQLLANDATHQEMHLCFFKQRKESGRLLEGESVQGAFYVELDGFNDFKLYD